MIKNNILIANFLGLEKQEDNTYFDYEVNEYINQEDLNYNESWDMLMLVVSKIREYHNGTESLSDKQISQLLDLVRGLNEALTLRNEVSIMAVYNACVTFIEWWNKETKSNKL